MANKPTRADIKQWMKLLSTSKEDSLAYAIAYDKLIEYGLIPDDDPIEDIEAYWDQFRK